MKIESVKTTPQATSCDWLVLFVWEGVDTPTAQENIGRMQESARRRIAELKQAGDFEGKRNETLCLYESLGCEASRVLLVGLGKPESFTATHLARATGTALRTLSKRKGSVIALASLPNGSSLAADIATRAQVIGALVAEGSQELFRTTKTRTPPERLLLTDAPSEEAIRSATVVGEAIRWSARLVNLTPEEIYPESFCAMAQSALADLPISTEVLGKDDLTRLKMMCLLGVGRGSRHEPKLLVARYQGAPSESRQLALIGKGITFDSGGLSLKTAEGMLTMKCDMAGAAAVVAATRAIAQLRIPVNIFCLAPLAENMPSSTAIKPGDVLRAKNGKSIEVVNTDAEGRLVLADALCHAVDLGATHLIDLATLTGACLVALGPITAGLMSNQADWARQIEEAAQAVGERVWKLPLDDEYEDLIRSGVADMKNSGGRYGGAITAAKLLEHFVSEKPWVHLDIAGPAFLEKETSYQDAGGTGFGVQTLIEVARRWAAG